MSEEIGVGWVKLKSLPGQKIDNQCYGFNYWKIEDGDVWHQEKKLRKADAESFEIREDNSQIFIARDKNYIFHAWTLEKTIDRDTFEEIGNGYWKDCNFAYFEHETSIKPLKGKDSKSFKYVGGPYARDSRFAYYCGRVLKNCKNPLDLKMMVPDDPWYVGDGELIYYDGAEIRGADYLSWRLIEEGFSRDKNTIYFGSKKLPRVNISDWKIVERLYSSDGKSLYHMHIKIKGADPATWEFLENDYCKDKNSVYFGDKVIEGADPDSFKVTGERSGRDKLNSYDGGTIKVV